MKLLLGILILMSVSVNDNLSNMRDKLKKINSTTLPFECTKTTSWNKPIYGVAQNEYGGLPIFTYADLGLTIHNDYDEDVAILRKFESGHDNYCIVALEIGVSEPSKQLLVTYGVQGDIIDYLESGVYFINDHRLYVKQWRINDKYEIIVTWIKVLSNKVLKYCEDFSPVQGERVDLYYKIDTKGKFQKVKEIKYAPMSYSKSYLEDVKKNLWEGNEVPVINE